MAGYLVTTVWWPDGWEPTAPLDVPKCLLLTGEPVAHEPMSYEQAVAALRGLNQQNMDRPGKTWYVLAAASDEPTAKDRLEILQTLEGGGRGDCSHCPAHHLPCATEG